MNTTFLDSVAWSGHRGTTVLAGRATTARANEARLYRRTVGPAPAYVSRALTVDPARSFIGHPPPLSAGKVAVYGASLLGAAAIGWAAFAVWELYMAVSNLTTFSQASGI